MPRACYNVLPYVYIFIRFPSPMSTSTRSVSLSLDARLKIIEGKLDRILRSLSMQNNRSSHSERIKKRPWASSPSCESDVCDDDGANQTTEDSEGLSERSMSCVDSTTTRIHVLLDILSDRPRVNNRVHRHAASFKQLAGEIPTIS